jgi:hypothetical protein
VVQLGRDLGESGGKAAALERRLEASNVAVEVLDYARTLLDGASTG